MLFEQIYEKTILHSSIRNAITLVEVSSQDNEFLKYYSDDAMAATFEVLKFQREYLYKTFGTHQATENQMKGRKDKKNMKLYRLGTKEQMANPYMVTQLLNPKIRSNEQKEKL